MKRFFDEEKFMSLFEKSCKTEDAMYLADFINNSIKSAVWKALKRVAPDEAPFDITLKDLNLMIEEVWKEYQ